MKRRLGVWWWKEGTAVDIGGGRVVSRVCVRVGREKWCMGLICLVFFFFNGWGGTVRLFSSFSALFFSPLGGGGSTLL